nr:hypothetical protein [Tanacetum cinerariifolium]
METVGSTVVQKSGIQCYNCKEYRHVARECQKSKRVSLDVDDSGPIFNKEPQQKVQTNDHYDVLAIENVHPKQSESVHKTYLIEQDAFEKLKSEIEDFKNKNKSLKEANNKLSEENDLLYADFKKSKAELKHRDSIEYASEMELECAKVKEMKNKLSAHQDTISILKQQKDAQIKLYKSREEKELEKVIDLENTRNYEKLIVYKTGCYNANLALMLSPESDEVIRLEKESRSKLSDLIRPFNYAKLNSLYDLFVPQREKSSEQRFFQKDQESSLELFNVTVQATTIFNGVEMCKKSITKSTYFDYLDPFIKNTIEQKFSPEIERILNGLNQFQRCLKEEMVADLRYFNSLESEVDSLRSQLETQKTQFSNEIDRLSREYYYADHMNAILGVYTELDEVTNLQCNYLELLQKCECLETELSKSKMMSKSFESVQKHAINLELELQQYKEKVKNDMYFKVNKSKDFCKEREQYFEIQDLKAQFLNAKTLNVKSVSAMCGKCVMIEKHDLCVPKSVPKPLRKTVASESIKKPKNIVRKLHERFGKIYKWTYIKFTPSGYMWKPKSKQADINPNVSMPLGSASRTANVKDTMTSRCSTVSNTPLSSN